MGQTQAGGDGLPDGFELLTDLGACYPCAAEQGGKKCPLELVLSVIGRDALGISEMGAQNKGGNLVGSRRGEGRWGGGQPDHAFISWR